MIVITVGCVLNNMDIHMLQTGKLPVMRMIRMMMLSNHFQIAMWRKKIWQISFLRKGICF